MMEGLQQRYRLRLCAQVVDRQGDEDHDEYQLDNHHDPVDPCHRLDADQVEEGHQGN
ncbi:hypothetical protein D3C76_1451950 [compost metagenome]